MRVRSVQVQSGFGFGQNFSNSCGAGLNFAARVWTQNFNPRRTLVPIKLAKFQLKVHSDLVNCLNSQAVHPVTNIFNMCSSQVQRP